MRWGAVLIMCACSADPPPVAKPAPPPPAPTPVASATPPPPPECVKDRDCKTDAMDSVAVCEASKCSTWDLEKTNVWASTAWPELATLKKTIKPPPTIDNVAWIDRKKPNTLFVDGGFFWSQVKSCVPVKLAWEENGLTGKIAAKYGDNPDANGAVVYTLALSTHVIHSGPSSITKDKNGNVVAGMGTSGADIIGHHLLFDTTRGLLYRGAEVRLEAECIEKNIQSVADCPPCNVCSGYRLREIISEHGMASHTVKVDIKLAPKGVTCDACPTRDPGSDVLPRLLLLTRDMSSLSTDTFDGPGFYRKAADCDADRKARAVKL